MNDVKVFYDSVRRRYCLQHGTNIEEIHPLTRQYIEDLVVERDTLRQQLTNVVITNGRLEERCAKLRRLVHILCFCMHESTDCDECKLNDGRGEMVLDAFFACDGLHELLREAGIEVP